MSYAGMYILPGSTVKCNTGLNGIGELPHVGQMGHIMIYICTVDWLYPDPPFMRELGGGGF